MNSKKFHGVKFDEATRSKLELYRQYLLAWLSVFMNGRNRDYIENINVVDFFCGPGRDSEGTPGSPLIALKAASDALETSRERLNSTVRVNFFFNDVDPAVITQLRQCVSGYEFNRERIKVDFSCKPFVERYGQLASPDNGVLRRRHSANFLFIDQFGVKEVTQSIFENIQRLPRTDFIFFVAASIVNRMPEHPNIKDKIPVLSDEEQEKLNGKNVVRVLAKAYKKWIISPSFHLGQFALRKQKSSNVNGLVFGSGNILGLDRFLHAAWAISPIFGEANYSVDDANLNPNTPSLFPEENIPTRTKQFSRNLREEILTGHLKTNHEVYYFTVQEGFLPSHAREVIVALRKEKAVTYGTFPISYDCLRKPPEALGLGGSK